MSRRDRASCRIRPPDRTSGRSAVPLPASRCARETRRSASAGPHHDTSGCAAAAPRPPRQTSPSACRPRGGCARTSGCEGSADGQKDSLACTESDRRSPVPPLPGNSPRARCPKRCAPLPAPDARTPRPAGGGDTSARVSGTRSGRETGLWRGGRPAPLPLRGGSGPGRPPGARRVPDRLDCGRSPGDRDPKPEGSASSIPAVRCTDPAPMRIAEIAPRPRGLPRLDVVAFRLAGRWRLPSRYPKANRSRRRRAPSEGRRKRRILPAPGSCAHGLRP